MATPSRRTVEVWAALRGAPLARVGLLNAAASRGKEIFSFEYERAWLESEHAQELDPSLRLHRGPQHLRDGQDNFGVFLDSSPDRWGRVLLQRREAQLARREQRPEQRLLELDYLLGVYDGHRMGALRYRIAEGPFLDDNTELASPPWTSLRALEEASLQLEEPRSEKNPNYDQWLRMLIAPGRSLGGARPKASVIDGKKRLWMAKFPSRADDIDVGAWEGVVHALALRAGITLAEAKVQRLGSSQHTFLTRRFDRTDQGDRIHFASAMTMLQRRDGEEGASYLDLAEVLMAQGAHTARDLEQLWRRIVFTMCVSNVDDHLRNHGFLLEPAGGWSLAPAYDLNPVAHGDGLTLNVSETDNAQDLALARDVAQHFRVKAKQTEMIIAQVRAAVSRWRTEATRVGISRAEQDRMAAAFRLAES